MNQNSNNPLPNKTIQIYDFVIVGGGMAGATAALALAQLGLTIAIVEAIEPELEISPSFDQRAVALSASSVAIFQSLGIWPLLKRIACPIKHISVSDQGHFGFTRLDADDYKIDALGEALPLDLTGPVLWQLIYQQSNIDVFCPAKVESVETDENFCRVVIYQQMAQNTQSDKSKTTTSSLTGKLLIAADGTYSTIANQLNIDYLRNSYQQHAIIANIETELPHNNRAFERFTRSGPLALLPLANLIENNEVKTNKIHQAARMSLVWCFKPDEIESIQAMSDETFIHRLQQTFGYRLGRILKVGKRFSYPLSLHIADQSFAQRVLLLGNAAHTLHPIAGQGFNLGLRDIACFIEDVEEALSNSQDFGSLKFLSQFVKKRESDWLQTINATDTLVRLFSNQFLPLVFSRNKTMIWLNLVPFLKKQLAQAAMGYKTRSSRLARGFKLEQPKTNSRVNHE